MSIRDVVMKLQRKLELSNWDISMLEEKTGNWLGLVLGGKYRTEIPANPDPAGIP